jgi:hypothetical protein
MFSALYIGIAAADHEHHHDEAHDHDHQHDPAVVATAHH